MTNYSLEELTLIAINASLKAGDVVIKHYKSSYSVEYKKDMSPLTSADKEAHEVISEILAQTELPVLSEEGKDISFEKRKEWELFWLVDPLDGTKEFINGNGEFTVNIALINNGAPVLGVVYIPVTQILYFGNSISGSYRLDKKVQSQLKDYADFLKDCLKLPLLSSPGLTILGSRSHLTYQTSEFIKKLENTFGEVSIINAGSSLKFCKLAEGSADIYPRLGPTMEWDTAAGHAVCKYASISVIDVNTKLELTYNKSDLLNPWFVAFKQELIQLKDLIE